MTPVPQERDPAQRPRLPWLRPSWPRLSWLRVAPLLAWPVARTMPWGTLLAGCLAGTLYLAGLAHFAGATGSPLDYDSARLAFLPAVAALAFVPRIPLRPLTQTTPVPAWLAPAGQLLLAAPILAVTCWGQVRIIVGAVPPRDIGHLPAVYPLIAQLTGWCAVAVAAAAWVGRSRYADLGGAVAAPVSFAAIAFAWYTPAVGHILLTPPAAAHIAAIAWAAIAATASTLTCAAIRDQWHRYARALHRLSPPQGFVSGERRWGDGHDARARGRAHRGQR